MEGLVPITPEEVIHQRGNAKNTIPMDLLRLLNTMISERWDGEQAVIPFADITKRGFTFGFAYYACVYNAFSPFGWKVKHKMADIMDDKRYLGDRLIFKEKK